MKTKLLILTLLLPCTAPGQETAGTFRDAATSESLAAEYRKVSLVDPIKAVFPEAKGEDPTVVNRVGDLLENSDVLTFNGQTTLVPKNALVLIPEKLSDRINNHQPGAEIVGWLEFFALNRGWISTVEVTFAQARGDEPVSPETLANLGKNGNLVVAVLKSGPISVMPPKPENPIQTASKETQP